MAVEIIDEGPDPSVVKEIICKKCGCKLRYVPNDVKVICYRDYDTDIFIVCAKCKNRVNTK